MSASIKTIPPKTKPSSLGVVHFYIHGESSKSNDQRKHPAFTTSKMIAAIKGGLHVRELNMLQNTLDMPMERLAPKLGISRATLHRRKAGGRLGPEESDRVARFARLIGKAIEVFQTEENARRWLKSPQVGLGGAVPLDYAETEIGAREVEDLLGRIEFGVYS
jgi:putative toxin-antitoxin system antitoxin component (TIGR02293 family)